MNLKPHKPRYSRRKSEQDGWERAIDALAMHICPAEEWQAYERQLQQVAWKNTTRLQGNRMHAPVVRVFPVWRKYRQKALRVATLQKTIPLLKYFPLGLSCFLGDVLFK
jgi:hypothetical protein